LRTQQKLNTYGIVNVRVPGSYRGDMFSDYKLIKQLRDEKRLTLRYSILLPAFGATDPVAFQQKVAAAGIPPNEGDDFVRVWGVKTGVDGGFEGGHMSMPYQEPYGKGGTFFGLTVVPPDKYNAFVSAIHKMGFRVATHAVGDAAVDQVLDAYEKANAEKDLTGEGWAIEHAFVTRPEQLPRMKGLGLALSVQDHLYLAAPTLKNYWGIDRAFQVTPVKTYRSRLPVGGRHRHAGRALQSVLVDLSLPHPRHHFRGHLRREPGRSGSRGSPAHVHHQLCEIDRRADEQGIDGKGKTRRLRHLVR
jgi:predicted amidohydrolase YtcJ